MKRLFWNTVMISVLVLFLSANVSAVEVDINESEGLEYALGYNSQYCYITGIGDCTDTN